MADGIYAALAGAVSTSQALEVIANNLANVNTTGFKQDRITFSEFLAETGSSKLSTPSLRHAIVDEIRPDFRNGAASHTGNAFDLSIEGSGFFAVQTPMGEQYTRAGSFRLAEDGTLVTQSGEPVLGKNGIVRIDAMQPFRIDEMGVVWNDNRQVDSLRLVEFAQPGVLLRQGKNLWSAPQDAENFDVERRLRVGALEQSNVNAVESMTQLVWISRAYESFHRVIEMFREADSRTVNDLGR